MRPDRPALIRETFAEKKLNPISFRDVAHLVNRIPGTRIDVESPRAFEADQYGLYSGSVSGSGFLFEFEILYLYADATKERTRGARTLISRKSDKTKIRCVYAPSITMSVVDEVRALGVECISLADYFLTFLSQQTEVYIRKIQGLSSSDYIDPQIDTPAGFTRKSPNPVFGFMSTPEQSAPRGDIAVLLGEPGQGKTHMSKYLAAGFTRRKIIPVYVHSEQWTKMQLEDLSSIWKAILASFRYFDAPISWAEGVEKDFVRVALRLGVIRLIFDGFDEFILWNRGTVDPRESLQELLGLADDTGTTLCITSRTSFWKAEIAEEETSIVGRERLYEFVIRPFDTNHARNYFKKRFGDSDSRVTTSVQLFERLKQDSSNDAMSFVGRGFFLSLIADLVSRGFIANQAPNDGLTRLQWIMDALCQREQTRQKLPLDASAQLQVLRDFAEITAKGESRSSATLRMVLEVTTGLEPEQIDELVKNPAKFKDHPLICHARDSGNWTYTQDQIEYVLLAERVLEQSARQDKHSELQGLLNSEIFVKSLQNEVATSLVQQVFELRSDAEALEECKKIISAISRIGPTSNIANSSTGSHQFAGRVALLAAGKAHGRGAERAERTNALLNLLPAGQLVGVEFVGAMSGLDLRDLEIANCHFDTVTFANCRFSKTTRFVNCRFTELRVTNCDQFGNVIWDPSNRFDDSSRRLIEAEMVTTGRRSYADENLSADLDCLVRRFLPRETSAFKNLEERNLSRGLIAHSIYKNQIIETFKKYCLESHPVEGNPVYCVNEKSKRDFMFYVGNGVFTGELAKIRDELHRKLGLHQ